MSDFNRLIDRGDHLLEMNRPQEAIKEFQRANVLAQFWAVLRLDTFF